MTSFLYVVTKQTQKALTVLQEFCKVTIICQPVGFVYIMFGDIVYLGLREL